MKKTALKLWMRAGMDFSVEMEDLENKSPEQMRQEIEKHLAALKQELNPILEKYGVKFDGESYTPQSVIYETFKSKVSDEKLKELYAYEDFDYLF